MLQMDTARIYDRVLEIIESDPGFFTDFPGSHNELELGQLRTIALNKINNGNQGRNKEVQGNPGDAGDVGTGEDNGSPEAGTVEDGDGTPIDIEQGGNIVAPNQEREAEADRRQGTSGDTPV
jgi:hypothetical protein